MLDRITSHNFFINLLRRKDRYDSMKNQLDKLKISATATIAVDALEIRNSTPLRDGELALLLSYQKVVAWAKNSGFPCISIFEDDALFCSDFNERLEKEWPLIPDDWQLIYLGENNCSLGAGWIPSESVNEKVRRIYSSFGAHAIIIKESMYQPILDGISRFDKPLDVMYCDLQQQYPVYGFHTPLVQQGSFISDIIGFNAGYYEQGVFAK